MKRKEEEQTMYEIRDPHTHEFIASTSLKWLVCELLDTLMERGFYVTVSKDGQTLDLGTYPWCEIP